MHLQFNRDKNTTDCNFDKQIVLVHSVKIDLTKSSSNLNPTHRSGGRLGEMYNTHTSNKLPASGAQPGWHDMH